MAVHHKKCGHRQTSQAGQLTVTMDCRQTHTGYSRLPITAVALRHIPGGFMQYHELIFSAALAAS